MSIRHTWLSKALVLVLSELLILLPAFAGRSPQQNSQPAPTTTLRTYLNKNYLELFSEAHQLHYSTAEITAQRQSLASGKKACVKRFQNHAKTDSKQIDALQKELSKKTGKISEAERKETHCQIQNLDLLKSEAQDLAQHGIPTAYDNLSAKLDVIQNWPATRAQAEKQIADESFHQRRWGNVKDIGFRVIAANQEDDIRTGQDAIREMRQKGLIPPELPDKAIQEYVNSVAQNIAKHSDLKIPLHVAVLQSREINAFALPGGYIFVERGLLEQADDESELAGVLAHEIAHDVARHSHKLMNRASMASILFQAAQIGAIVLTGGAPGVGLAYAMQYGFYGLGMVMNLKLLGVSRDYELEADQLGVQYAWNTGYDPMGFTRFFDKMATNAGYVNGMSWFRTHPPFYDRMMASQKEIMFLPAKDHLIVQTQAFEQMKKELAPIAAKQDEQEVGKPNSTTRAEGCTPPKKLEYKPGQPIEDLCATEPTITPPQKPAKQ